MCIVSLPVSYVGSSPRDRAGQGALLGATLLGVGGLLLRYALRGSAHGGGRRLGAAAEAGAVLALTGALAGALIGGALEETEGPPECW